MALADYQTANQISPIVLVAGVAGTGMLALSAILSANAFSSVVQGNTTPANDFFGQFCVMPGHSLIKNEIAKYPLANMSVASNAVITDPLSVSVEMLVPANGTITLANKMSLITALKKTLDSHTAQGGYYNVATPSYIYQGCLLLELVDATEMTDGAQPQVRWIWEFEQPLVTAAAAQAAQNQAMAKISNQTANAGDPPGSQPVTTGISDPSSNISQNIVPANAAAPAANVAPTANLTGNNSGIPSYTSTLAGGFFQ